MLRFLKKMDKTILMQVQKFRKEPYDKSMKIITSLGNGGVIWLLIALILHFNKKTKRIGTIAIISLAVCTVVNNYIIKIIVRRNRPFKRLKDLFILIPEPMDYSFPSGHTCSSFAVAGILCRYMNRWVGFSSMVLAGMIGFSRIYVGVHYPTDVISGMIVGLLGSQVIWMLEEKILPNK